MVVGFRTSRVMVVDNDFRRWTRGHRHTLYVWWGGGGGCVVESSSPPPLWNVVLVVFVVVVDDDGMPGNVNPRRSQSSNTM